MPFCHSTPFRPPKRLIWSWMWLFVVNLIHELQQSLSKACSSMPWCMLSHWNTSSVCSTSHHIELHRFAILPPSGPKVANFHSDAIVCGKTELWAIVTFQSLFIHAMVYDEPLKHFISVYHFLKHHTIVFCHSTPFRPQNGSFPCRCNCVWQN